jgi:S-methylmethionine-dependent homocysteine/selenocysteine methylase
MTGFRKSLPQLAGSFFLTDGGLETTLVFLDGLELPDFAAFDLFKRKGGEAALNKYYLTYAALARRFGTGLILETATWRANADWGEKLGYTSKELADANTRAISLLEKIRDEFEGDSKRVVLSGCVGPRGDGYVPGKTMSAQEAQRYHQGQIRAFEGSAADMITAITMNYVEEATGIARASEYAGMPVAISFTVETDGRLPTGQTLGAAIEQVDAATSGYPSYYMINCAHPTHFEHVLDEEAPWTQRIHGLRANASRKSHAELNASPALDIGDPHELGLQYAQLKRRFSQLNVMGGCCGTDHRHVEQIATTCSTLITEAI